jgi:hypothetical protein
MMDQFDRDCMRWRGKVLTGKFAHWCEEWDGLPVDETTPEWPCGCRFGAEKQTEAFDDAQGIVTEGGDATAAPSPKAIEPGRDSDAPSK